MSSSGSGSSSSRARPTRRSARISPAGPKTPLADRLRVDWLKTLGKRGQWSTFAADYPPPAGEDVELACYGVQYRRQRDGDVRAGGRETALVHGPGDARVLRAVVRGADREGRPDRRGSTRALPPGDRSRQRPRRAGDRDGPAARRPDHGAGNSRTSTRVRVPRSHRGEFRWKQQGGSDLALYALERAARTDAAGVRAAWEKQRGRLSDADRLYGNARIAFHAARQQNPLAAEWFRETGNAALSDAQRAWRVRAALRAGAWPDVLAAIEAMPPSEQEESAWRYWKARALAALGRAGRRRGDLRRDSPARSVSTACCRRRRSDSGRRSRARRSNPTPRRWRPSARPPPCAARSSSRSSTCGRSRSGSGSTSCAGSPTRRCSLAAEYARREGLYDRAINTAERTSTRHDFGLRYLMPFRPQFATAAQEHAVDAALLFGIARQESRFVAGHRVLRRRGGVDAADAADGAMGREAVESLRLPSVADFRCRRSIRSSARTISSTGSTGSIACRRSRPPRTMPVPAARRPGAPAPRSKAPSGSKRSRSTRPATT